METDYTKAKNAINILRYLIHHHADQLTADGNIDKIKEEHVPDAFISLGKLGHCLKALERIDKTLIGEGGLL